MSVGESSSPCPPSWVPSPLGVTATVLAEVFGQGRRTAFLAILGPVSEGASAEVLAGVEAALGVRLTAAHRALLRDQDGFGRWYGEVFLFVYGTEDVIAVNHEMTDHPGFLAFGSDGSRELIGFDLRAPDPPVVMIDITSAGWDAALYQAESLAAFMAQRERGEDFRWDRPYRP